MIRLSKLSYSNSRVSANLSNITIIASWKHRIITSSMTFRTSNIIQRRRLPDWYPSPPVCLACIPTEVLVPMGTYPSLLRGQLASDFVISHSFIKRLHNNTCYMWRNSIAIWSSRTCIIWVVGFREVLEFYHSIVHYNWYPNEPGMISPIG